MGLKEKLPWLRNRQRIVIRDEKHLQQLLEAANAAHHVHEKKLGHPDPKWPEWYAHYINVQVQQSSDYRAEHHAVQDAADIMRLG